jgi:hypothetical protein
MKNIALVSLIFTAFVMTGCVTTGPDNKVDAAQTVENALPYIAPAVTLTCTVVLDQAVSDSDRVEKAKMINHVAAIVEGLTRGATPTPDQLQKALNDYLPVEKTHWAKYVVAIKDLYATQFNKVGGSTKLAVDVLNAIAKGCKDATESYVN